MSKLPVLPLYTYTFIADTGHLSAEETGAYIMLLMVAWRTEGCSLPDDDRDLARYARVTSKVWLRIKSRVLSFWHLEDGRWTQKRLSQEQLRASQRASVNRDNETRGGRPKSLENIEPENPAGLRNESETKASISISINSPKPQKSETDFRAAFAEFKSAYPKRDGSQDWVKAEARFAGLVKNGTDPARLISAATAYHAEASRKVNLGSSYVKQAATFLSGAWKEYGPSDQPASAKPTSLPPGWPNGLPAPDRMQDAWSRGQWPGQWGPRPRRDRMPAVVVSIGHDRRWSDAAPRRGRRVNRRPQDSTARLMGGDFRIFAPTHGKLKTPVSVQF